MRIFTPGFVRKPGYRIVMLQYVYCHSLLLCAYVCLWSSNSEFCGENLSKHRFTRAVKKLNANILHLCFSQVGGMNVWILQIACKIATVPEGFLQ